MKSGKGKINKAAYIELLGNTMDGGDSGVSVSRSLVWIAYFVLILFIFGFSFGFYEYYTTGKDLQSHKYGLKIHSSFSWNAYLKLTICLATAIFFMVMILFVYSKFKQGKSGLGESVVSVSVFAFPMLIGVFLSYILFLILIELNAGDLVYIIPNAVMLIASVSALLFLYASTKSILALKLRSRYYATLFSILVFVISLQVSSILISG